MASDAFLMMRMASLICLRTAMVTTTRMIERAVNTHAAYLNLSLLSAEATARCGNSFSAETAVMPAWSSTDWASSGVRMPAFAYRKIVMTNDSRMVRMMAVHTMQPVQFFRKIRYRKETTSATTTPPRSTTHQARWRSPNQRPHRACALLILSNRMFGCAGFTVSFCDVMFTMRQPVTERPSDDTGFLPGFSSSQFSGKRHLGWSAWSTTTYLGTQRYIVDAWSAGDTQQLSSTDWQ
mmetsp:Transcript_9994/g.35022  ORF Transcript_9994/g.35022 Transcript_9994/m.35022 type:complete len:237 (-) Transcript_9994:618-1328(-)